MSGVLTNITEQSQANLAMIEFETLGVSAKIYRTDKIQELTYAAVISEGTETVQRNKNEILAIDKKEDIQYGSDLTASHIVFSPEIFALIDGGSLVMSSSEPKKVVGYNPPAIGTVVKREKFNVRAYSEIKEGDEIVGYNCIEFKTCKGKPISFNLKDGDFIVTQYTISSRPPKGELPYNIKIVDALPAESEPKQQIQTEI